MVIVDEDRRVSPTPPRRSARTALRLAAEAAERNRSMAGSRLEMMRGYAETTDCRRRYLLGYFGEELAMPCGSCDNCDAGTSVAGGEGARHGLEVSVPVRHREFGPGVVMQRHNGRVTVLFDEVGYKTLDVELATARNALEVRGSADAAK
jgi:ATP-dependent DNA helicase RecQ